jgi:predicted HNH restriction endonuclease
MAWIFQGNPERFDIDDYIARYPQLIYWRAPRFAASIRIGDRAYVWRSGDEAGVVASGFVVESAVPASQVEVPEALGDDLWVKDKPTSDEPKVGVSLDSVRLSVAEGMVTRSTVKDDAALSRSTIIRMASASVFRLDEVLSARMEALWARGDAVDAMAISSPSPSALEGGLQLVAHRRRERSRFLVSKKLAQVRSLTGTLACEICGLNEAAPYPSSVASSVFEVHHREPIASATSPRRTTLDGLAVVCANCHRAVHATKDVDQNYALLVAAFREAG